MAFPTTPVLDDFNRANENPLSNGTWAGNIFGDTAACKLDTNEATAAAPFASSRWSAATFGPDIEVYTDIELLSQNTGVIWRVTNPGASVNGYEAIYFPAESVVRVYKIVSGVETQIGADIAQAFSVGDGLGAAMAGTGITIYRRSSGVWGSIATRTDGTNTTAGYLAVAIDTGTYIDNFGGGTLVGGGGAVFNPISGRGGSAAQPLVS